MTYKLINVKQTKQAHSTLNRIAALSSEENCKGWEHFHEGIPIHPDMVQYVNGVVRGLPGVTLLPSEISYYRTKQEDGNTLRETRIVTEFFVCVDDCPFALGTIGYRDYRVEGDSDRRFYGVYSRKIKNIKYAPQRDQHYMILANNWQKGVSNALRFLSRFSPKELAKAYYYQISEPVFKIKEQAGSAVTEAVKPLSYAADTAIAAEFEHLLSLGVEFKTDLFRDVAAKAKEAITIYREKTASPINATFVRFKTVCGEQYAELCDAPNITGKSKYSKDIDGKSDVVHINDLSPDIVNGVSVLSILNDGQYVEGVGTKIDATTFWVERS